MRRLVVVTKVSEMRKRIFAQIDAKIWANNREDS